MNQEKPESILSKEERSLLLQIAREAINTASNGQEPAELVLANLPGHLQQDGASFVTLTNDGQLRGCIGALEASQPLALDVQEHAIAAATQDYRFQNVHPEEVPEIEIEVSLLSPMQKLEYSNTGELKSKLRPGIDGVTLIDGYRRATFLPQVWEKVTGVEEFLNHLCMKMGASPDYWRTGRLDVYIYQVEEFKES
jgi:AmmeMemoRadiSam system protein A